MYVCVFVCVCGLFVREWWVGACVSSRWVRACLRACDALRPQVKQGPPETRGGKAARGREGSQGARARLHGRDGLEEAAVRHVDGRLHLVLEVGPWGGGEGFRVGG